MSKGPRSIISAVFAFVAADARRGVLALAVLWIMGSALTMGPVAYGDGGEYHLTAESFVRHLSPEARPADVASLAAHSRRHGLAVNFAAVLGAYFESHQGAWYAVHFWGYALVIAPMRAVLRAVGANDLRSGQITNALVFLWALQQTLFGAGFAPRVALYAGLLLLFSPAVWFVGWTHPEAFCFSAVALALAWYRGGRTYGPVLASALGAMQNPALLWLVAPLWVHAVWPRQGRLAPRRAALATAAALPAALPAVFSLWMFGTPSLIARETASVANLSLERALELFFDLNIGLLPYAPIAVVMAMATLPLSFADRRWAMRTWGAATVAGLAAWTCTSTTTWNHGTAGPSRYAVWLAPFVFFMVAEASEWVADRAPSSGRRAWAALVACAVLVQILVVVGRGGLAQADDGERHSYAARLALRHVPAAYNPTPDIFVSRTLGRWARPDEPAVYRDGGRCRKAWVRPRDAGLLRQVCGELPAERAFFEQRGPDRRHSWSYVHYPRVFDTPGQER